MERLDKVAVLDDFAAVLSARPKSKADTPFTFPHGSMPAVSYFRGIGSGTRADGRRLTSTFVTVFRRENDRIALEIDDVCFVVLFR